MELFDRRTAPKRHDTWFVYALVDSREPEEIRYVGITNDPRRRLQHHCCARLDSRTRRARWCAKVLRCGGDVLLGILCCGISQVEAKRIECIEIASRRNLTNLTDGGDGATGWVPSDEVRAKIAAKARGRTASAETRAKLRLANMGRVSPNKGKVLPPEWRARISAAGRSRMSHASARDQISRAGKARYASAAERERTAIATRKVGPLKNNRSGFKGVSFCNRTKRWVAQIKDEPRRRMIGRYRSPEEAAHAYDRAAFSAWGCDCYLNFPEEVATQKESSVFNCNVNHGGRSVEVRSS